MGLTSKRKERPPVKFLPTDKRRISMSKAQVLEEKRIQAEKERKVAEFKAKLEEETNGVRVEEIQKKQEVSEEVLNATANAPEIRGSISPLVKKRGRPAKSASDNV